MSEKTFSVNLLMLMIPAKKFGGSDDRLSREIEAFLGKHVWRLFFGLVSSVAAKPRKTSFGGGCSFSSRGTCHRTSGMMRDSRGAYSAGWPSSQRDGALHEWSGSRRLQLIHNLGKISTECQDSLK